MSVFVYTYHTYIDIPRESERRRCIATGSYILYTPPHVSFVLLIFSRHWRMGNCFDDVSLCMELKYIREEEQRGRAREEKKKRRACQHAVFSLSLLVSVLYMFCPSSFSFSRVYNCGRVLLNSTQTFRRHINVTHKEMKLGFRANSIDFNNSSCIYCRIFSSHSYSKFTYNMCHELFIIIFFFFSNEGTGLLLILMKKI